MSHLQSQRPRATVLDFLAQRNQYYPIYTSLSSYLGIAEIVALTRTCKKLSKLYQELLPIQWDIDRDLCRFVENPCQFRTQLGLHNALVAGDFAHYFFSRETWKTSKVEVLIESGDSINAFVEYLLQEERYELGSFNDEWAFSNGWKNGCWNSAHTLNRKSTQGQLLSQIHAIAATRSPPVHRLVDDESGSVNIITWNKAYAIFPQFAFIDQAGRSLESLRYRGERYLIECDNHCSVNDMTYGGAVEEFLEDGEWHEINYGGIASSYRHNRTHQNTKRRIGDRLTWTISFGPSKVTPPKTLDDVSHTHFGMCQVFEPYDDERRSIYRSHTDVVVGTWMTHVYDPKDQRPGRKVVVRQRFHGARESREAY